jgi:DNA polymerase-1
VNYLVVGYRDWLDTAFEPGAIPEGRRAEIEDEAGLKHWTDWLLEQWALAWDSESTGPKEFDGLDPLSKTSRLVLFQIGTEDLVLVMQPELLKSPLMKQVMENENIVHIAQHTKHDFKFLLKKYGIHPINLYCTMLAEQLLTAGQDGVSVSLQAMARKYPPYRIILKEERENFALMNDRPLTREMLYYAARDVVLPFPIYRAQIKQLIQDLHMEAVAQDEFDCIPVTAEMELGGFLLNEKLIRMSLPYYEARRDELRQEIFEIYTEELKKLGRVPVRVIECDLEQFDLNSPQKIVQALNRIELFPESAEAEALEELQVPVADLIVKYGEIKKVLTTYGEKLFEKIHPDTGLWHPQFHQMGSGESSEGKKKETIATGRYSSNAQQWKRGDHNYAPVVDPAELELVKQLEARTVWDDLLEAA